MESLWIDLGHAARRLARDPAHAALALLTLAVCIGANTAVFSVLHARLVDPLDHLPEPDRLVAFFNRYPNSMDGRLTNSTVDYFDRRELTEVFEEVAMYSGTGFTIDERGIPTRVPGLAVTASFFRLLRVEPLLGRTFEDAEIDPGAEPTVILSETLWRRAFDADETLVGRTIPVDGIQCRVVGIVPSAFRFMRPKRELWIPIVAPLEERTPEFKHANQYSMIARLRAGVSVDAARAAVDRLNAELEPTSPALHEAIADSGYYTETIALTEFAAEPWRRPLLLLQAGVSLVLLVGCLNVANLSLGRLQGRTRELALRICFGASRRRVVRQLVTEAFLLAATGSAVGLLVGAWGVDFIARVWGQDAASGDAFTLNVPVATFAIAAAFFSTAVTGAVVAVHLGRRDLGRAIAQDARTASPGSGAVGLRNTLVVAQVALAFVLLVGTGLLVRSLRAVLEVETGFEAESVHVAQIDLPPPHYPEAQSISDFIAALDAGLAELESVRAFAFSSSLPFHSTMRRGLVANASVPRDAGATAVPFWNGVGPAYFATLGVPLLSGRVFSPADDFGSARVAIVDTTLAEALWPGESPLGKQVSVDVASNDASALATVVGVVGSVRVRRLDAPDAEGALYFPIAQAPTHRLAIALRAEDPARAFDEVLTEATRLNAQVALHGIRKLDAHVRESVAGRRIPIRLLQVFAGIALFLCSVGLYGVVANSVALQRREIGIRLALGARAKGIVRMVVRRGLALSAVGLVAGFAILGSVSGVVAALLFGVGRFDPSTLAAATLAIALVCVVASWIPARQAARVRPAEILRDE
jgi:predicted permease